MSARTASARQTRRSATRSPALSRPRWMILTVYLLAAVVVVAFVSGLVFLSA